MLFISKWGFVLNFVLNVFGLPLESVFVELRFLCNLIHMFYSGFIRRGLDFSASSHQCWYVLRMCLRCRRPMITNPNLRLLCGGLFACLLYRDINLHWSDADSSASCSLNEENIYFFISYVSLVLANIMTTASRNAIETDEDTTICIMFCPRLWADYCVLILLYWS
jgi:hypothetical protein